MSDSVNVISDKMLALIQDATNAAYNRACATEWGRGVKAGMAFEALVGTGEASVLERSYGYRAPLRTGIIHVEGVRKLGIIEASKILSWEDIVDPQGRVLVVSWPVGAKEPVEEWL